jgi:transcriptional antiterminator RfaH
MGQGSIVSSNHPAVGSQRSAVTSHLTSVRRLDDRRSPRLVSGIEPLGDLGADATPWLVVRTKIKCEKFVRDRLQAMGMQAFVPLKKRIARYQRKVVTYEHPLISCYTFVRFGPQRRNDVLALPYVQGMLRTDGKDCRVSEKEMQWLQKVSGTDLDIKTETLSMPIGEQVILAYGQLAGMEGTIVKQHSKHEVLVALESLGLQMVVQVEASMVVKKW